LHLISPPGHQRPIAHTAIFAKRDPSTEVNRTTIPSRLSADKASPLYR
jgi:hypothetical protein